MQRVNLTIPHQVAVMEHLDEIAPHAAIVGAVNTLRRDCAKPVVWDFTIWLERMVLRRVKRESAR